MKKSAKCQIMSERLSPEKEKEISIMVNRFMRMKLKRVLRKIYTIKRK